MSDIILYKAQYEVCDIRLTTQSTVPPHDIDTSIRASLGIGRNSSTDTLAVSPTTTATSVTDTVHLVASWINLTVNNVINAHYHRMLYLVSYEVSLFPVKYVIIMKVPCYDILQSYLGK